MEFDAQNFYMFRKNISLEKWQSALPFEKMSLLSKESVAMKIHTSSSIMLTSMVFWQSRCHKKVRNLCLVSRTITLLPKFYCDPHSESYFQRSSCPNYAVSSCHHSEWCLFIETRSNFDIRVPIEEVFADKHDLVFAIGLSRNIIHPCGN